MTQDEHQVSGSFQAALADNQDMQGMQDKQSTPDFGLILTGDSTLDEWTRQYDLLTDPYAKIDQTQDEAFADLDDILGFNTTPASTHNKPPQSGNAEPSQLFETEQNNCHVPHHPELEIEQGPMTPGDVEHPYFPLLNDYTGLDLDFELPQDPWPMVDDFNAPLGFSTQAANLQPEQFPVWPSIETPATGAYQSRFNNFEAAHAAITSSHTKEAMLPLGLVADDWDEVARESTHYYAARLFDALCEPPFRLPEAINTDYQKTYWREHQDSTLALVSTAVKSSPEVAEARAMLVVEAVINLHSQGCPASVMNRKTLKEGYKLDATLTATARLEQIIDAASRDKYVAHDIVTGTNIPDIVRSPMSYLRRKADNSRVNAKKAMDKEEADRNKGLVAKKRTGGRTGRSNAARLQQQNPYPTPAANSPPGFYGDMDPIPFSFDTGAGSTFQRPPDGGEEMDFKFD